MIQIENFKMDLKTKFQEIPYLKTCFENDPIWLPKNRIVLTTFCHKNPSKRVLNDDLKNYSLEFETKLLWKYKYSK